MSYIPDVKPLADIWEMLLGKANAAGCEILLQEAQKQALQTLLARAKSMSEHYLQPHGKPQIYIEDLEKIIAELVA